MHKYLTTAFALSLLAMPALAEPPVVPPGLDKGPEQQQQQQQGQLQAQGQLQGQKQKAIGVGVGVGVAGSYAGANSGGNSISIDGDDVKPPAYAPSVNLTSHGCVGSAGGSAGAAGVISLGFGTTEEQERCTKMEAAKIFISLGMRDEAVALLKSIDWVEAALKKAEPKQAKRPASVAPVALIEKNQVAMARQWVDPDRGKPWQYGR